MRSQWTVHSEDAGIRLDKFLAAIDRAGSRGRAAAAIERGKVLVNGAEAAPSDAARRLADGDIVRLWIDRPGTARRGLGTIDTGEVPIVYEDDVLLVVNKPAGLLAVPLDQAGGPPSVYERIADRLRSHGRRQTFVVHRIDRETSGLLLFARDQRSHAALQAQFKRREPERIYRAVVHGCPDTPAGVWRDWIVWDQGASLQKKARSGSEDAKEAVTGYRIIETFVRASHLELRLETGRQNQIRVQADLRRHTVVGERRYATAIDPSRAIAFPRHALHAYGLAFAHPGDGRALRFEAPLPSDLRALLARLRREPL